jgi:hypothetical protein
MAFRRTPPTVGGFLPGETVRHELAVLVPQVAGQVIREDARSPDAQGDSFLRRPRMAGSRRWVAHRHPRSESDYAAARVVGAAGSVTLKVVPWPGELSTVIFPPWAVTNWRAMASPSPAPSPLRRPP